MSGLSSRKMGAQPPSTSLRFRPSWSVVLAITAVVIFSGSITSIAGVHLPGGTSSVGGQDSAAATQLAAASVSLSAGQGPAGGQPLTCSAGQGIAPAACSSVTPSVGQVGSQKWESEADPQARAGAVMTYDAKDRYVVLFGGFNGSTYLGDTWEFSHSEWVNLSPAQSPSPRANATIAYDSKDNYVVLFGGYDGTHTLGDTWKFVGGAWTQLSPITSPPARMDSTMSYDAADAYLVLFGGSSGSVPLGDTWTFVSGAWTSVTPSTPPSARWGSTSAFDTADNYVLLFGGYDGAHFVGDTWEYAAGQWTQLSPTSSPSPRYEAALTYDTSDSYAVLFGGASRSGSQWTALGDSWRYAGGVWTLVHPSAAPAARQAASTAYSGTDNAVVVFGGVSDGDPIAATDTWEYHAGNWKQILSQPETTWAEPAGAVGVATAYAPKSYYAVAFGGSTVYGPNAETWTYFVGPGSTSLSWNEIFPSTSPSARAYAGMAYDVKDGYVVLFGGMSAAGTPLGDTWTFSSGVWTQLSPSPSPSPRYGGVMTYDVADGYILLFGGTNGASYLSDTWTFHGGSWSQLTPATSPPARAFGGGAWDNATKTDYVVLFGATSGAAALGDSWKFIAGAWTALNPTGKPALPAPEWGMSVVADGKRNDVWMFGGCTSATVNPMAPSCPAGETQSTSWEYRSNSWNVVTTDNPLTGRPTHPPAVFFPAGVFISSPKLLFILSYGGITSTGQLTTDRWVYQSGNWGTKFALPTPVARYGQTFTFDDLSERNLMFGGIGPLSGGGIGFLGDTWMWDTGLWAGTNSTNNPSPRAFSSATFFGTLPNIKGPKAANYTVLFGGFGATGYLGDTWKWVGSPIGGHWTQLHPATSPPARANASLTYDAADHEVVLFGGQNSGGYLGDTWVYSVTGVWTEIFPAGPPPARAAASMAYDSEDGYVVLFGGLDSGGALGDTWMFVGGVWTQLHPTTSPSARYGAAIMDCPFIDKAAKGQPEVVFLVGGTTGTTLLGETWAFVGGQWTLVTASTPSLVPFAFGGLADDLDDGHPATFGGLGLGGPMSDFWEFKLGP